MNIYMGGKNMKKVLFLIMLIKFTSIIFSANIEDYKVFIKGREYFLNQDYQYLDFFLLQLLLSM